VLNLGEPIDWNRQVLLAQRHEQVLRLQDTLSYLRQHWAVPVPEEVIARAGTVAAEARGACRASERLFAADTQSAGMDVSPSLSALAAGVACLAVCGTPQHRRTSLAATGVWLGTAARCAAPSLATTAGTATALTLAVGINPLALNSGQLR
jgi:hypothetical protein